MQIKTIRLAVLPLVCALVMAAAHATLVLAGPYVEKRGPVLLVPASVRAQAIADYAIGQKRTYTVLEEISHNGQAQRVLATISIRRLAAGKGQIELSSSALQKSKMTAPMPADGRLITAQPDVANAYNGAVAVVRALPAHAKVGQQFTINFRFHARSYPDVTVPILVTIQFADASTVQLVGDGEVPGSSTLMGSPESVVLRGHCNIVINKGVLEHSAWSLTSLTMRQDKAPDTLSWSLYAPGERVPGSNAIGNS